MSKWKRHTIRKFAGPATQIEYEAEFQTVNEPERFDHVAGPEMLYLPDKNRIFVSAYACDFSNMSYDAATMISDDMGESWTFGKLDLNFCLSSAYLGDGKILLSGTDNAKQFICRSDDAGETVAEKYDFPAEPDGSDFNMWGDAFLADASGFVIAAGYSTKKGYRFEDGAKSHAGLRLSFDGGKTWSTTRLIPEWYGYNEVSLVRAANGDLVAALRKDYPKYDAKYSNDNTGGLGVSISTDNGFSWSEVNVLYDWGRHFGSMVLMPDGSIVMTYVVRMGYPETADHRPQFGIEAITGFDGGRTWDLDGRYILADWQGASSGPLSWLYGCQNTSTALLPDGRLLTAFSCGARSTADPALKARGAAYDICLVKWKPTHTNNSRNKIITTAAIDSEARNRATNRPEIENIDLWKAVNKNIAIPEQGAVITASECRPSPTGLLYDRYKRHIVIFDTVPSWVEIAWPNDRIIEAIRIHAGIPFQKKDPETECIPTEYRLQYMKAGAWADIIPPVSGIERFAGSRAFFDTNDEYFFEHKFPHITTDKIRIFMTATSDTGMRRGFGDQPVVPPSKRKTALRLIEIFEFREI